MSKTVLVVDESPATRKTIFEQVNNDGLEVNVVEAADGQQALEKFNQGRIDCVLLDWHMTNMDALSLVKGIRTLESGKSVLIVMMTDEDSLNFDKVKEAVEAGADKYLVKPLTPGAIREKLRKVLA
jgi:two-component system chemotaxis response regulator CheY